MAWIRRGLLVFAAFVSASCASPQSFRKLLVGGGAGPGGPGGVRVSSISARHGPALAYNLDLAANFRGPVRARRMGDQAGSGPQPGHQQHHPGQNQHQPGQNQHQPGQSLAHGGPDQGQPQRVKLSGVNVCGGQCCHGWSQTQGSQRCTKPNCIPQCQNGGMCLRPQLCVCKSGSKGKACEQTTAPTHPHPAGPANGHPNGNSILPQRPIPQQVLPNGFTTSSAGGMAQMKLTVKAAPQFARPYYIQQHIQQQIRPVAIHPGHGQQYVIKPKYYHTHTTQTHVQSQPERPIPLTVGHTPIHAAVGNHTGRIKVVFTPTICKVTCIGSRCQNNCEKGNTTTIISENGHTTDTLTAPNFRVVVCHLPCINGGKCSARDKCQCPPNFVGKFCQMPLQNGHQQHHQQTSGQTQVHSTHTLPLTYSNGQPTGFGPGVVNIHIKHPPEASVQVHQVSQLDDYHGNGHPQKGASSSSSYTYHHSESSQSVQRHSYNVLYPGQNGRQRPHQPVASKNTLGRCFQETAAGQCGKALPGLTKQEQCCGSIGTSWGFHKCQKCPMKPSIPLIDCPQGYKRINNSHCQDFDECQVQGVCANGNCVNTVGSYRCMCDPDYVLDPTLTSCISNTPAIQEEKGACFRLVGSGRQCLHPVSAQLSKQLCCCSVGKAWGPRCDKCPPPGTAKFKEICPGGMGYTVLPNPPVKRPMPVFQEPVDLIPPHPLPTPERPVEAFGKPEEIIPATASHNQGPVTPAVSERPVNDPVQPRLTVKMEAAFQEVVEKTSPPVPVEIFPSHAGQDLAPTQSAAVDECQINPYICGKGICYNTADGYTCHCNEGYQLDDGLTTCVDIDECEDSAACPSDMCYNEPGGYSCRPCPRGFVGLGGQCVDVDECQDEQVCVRGHCLNSEGSFHCQCGPGFRASPAGDQCDDVDECVEETLACAVGECVNNVGSYSCSCPEGLRQVNGTTCTDVDECVEEAELCSPHGKCLNTDGSYLCLCDGGFTASLDTPSCDDIDECGLNETRCGPHGFCENRLGSFRCLCDQGYQESADGQGCEDVNECELLSSVCGEAQCVNVDGSFLCTCPGGQDYNTMNAKCEPTPTASSVERKECYHHLNDENLCESVLTTNVTLQECCCTLGAGWGDNCEVHPCPVSGTDQFSQLCPSGRGFIPSGEPPYGIPSSDSYRDADECTQFGQEVCKEGFCLNTEGSYECYCKTGHDYDPVKLECRDINECLEESVCEGGQCLNTDGSFLCFCTHPMVLEPGSNRCVFASDVAEQHEDEQMDFEGICWQLTDNITCTRPVGPSQKTTYTECCCLHGEAWGMGCALCPTRNTEDYASMCNLPLGGGRRPYGHDALVAGPVHEYEVSPDFPPSEEHHLLPPFYDNEEYPYHAFEGLRAEECGVLNGCENGRCVRVQEGYTCDCLDGYTLDLSRMACIDVNECSELNSRMSLCKNARCTNTVGSYRCECLPGFRASERPNYCVPHGQ
ncbi:latent-transforming growth factor beta-binding protein 1 isoform 2-T2 [Menidia menidia]